jgi:hypothetical protein
VLAPPRAAWIGLAVAAIVWQAALGRPGTGLLLALALAPLALLRWRAGPGWLASALAPLLGAIGLAGAFPALAGQAAAWRARLALGALGYWWLTLAEPLFGRRLWLGPPSGAPAHGSWEHSLHGGLSMAGTLLSLGALLGAALWGAGALCLPLLVRGRRAAVDLVAASMWSAALAAAAPGLDRGLVAAASHASARGAVLGAVCGGALAMAARALRGPV